MHTCIHAYMHTCIHAYMHTCIHAYMHTCIRIHTQMCADVLYIYTFSTYHIPHPSGAPQPARRGRRTARKVNHLESNVICIYIYI